MFRAKGNKIQIKTDSHNTSLLLCFKITTTTTTNVNYNAWIFTCFGCSLLLRLHRQLDNSIQRMGEHEKKPSNKRFRPGTPIKYFHEKFRKNSTKEDLKSILRTTLTATRADRQRKVHSKQYVQLQRYKQIVQALEEEIRQREEQQNNNNKTSSDDSSTAVQEQQNLSEISLEEFELNLNSEAGFVDLDDELFDDLMQEIENVSNSTQYLLDDNALSVAMLESNRLSGPCS